MTEMMPWLGNKRIHYKETDSTNLRARVLAENHALHGTIVTADAQSAGRGRSGRSWESKCGEGLFMTMLLRPEILPQNASMLTLVAAVAVKRAIADCTGIQVQIKWPNDIVVNGKKLCGILTELCAAENIITYVLLGIGVNVSNRQFPETIENMATSLWLECGKEISKEQLLTEICRQFERCYAIFCQTQDLSGLAEEYNDALVNKGRQVRILDPKEPFTGMAAGINSQGELQVETKDGSVYVSSGEVSVRGMYGYV